MLFDARGMEETDMFRRLREMLPEFDACIMIEVLVSDIRTTKKIRSFAKMSGYKTSWEKKDGYFSVVLSGESCLTCG